METALPQAAHRPWRERLFPNGEWVLLLALLAEIAVFSGDRGKLLHLEQFL